MKMNENSIREEAAPLEMSPHEFRRVGYQLIDQIASFLESLPKGKVTSGEDPAAIRALLGNEPVPEKGASAGHLLDKTAELLFNHSLFNGHPRFLGYITSSAAPMGALADLLAGSINPNVGGWLLSPVASEIESQTVNWIAQLIGYPSPCGGILVSGGNVANFVGFLVARHAKADWDIRSQGLLQSGKQLTVYVSEQTHTWIQKAADLFGLGTEAIRWISTDESLRMDMNALSEQIAKDKKNKLFPFMVVGTAGTVSTGAVDPLHETAAICRENNLWFHVDGAYGAPAAVLPEASPELKALNEADSVAIDPHKWLYAPLEAGCTLVRNPQAMVETFSFHPEYYHFIETGEEAPINFYEFGPQNSRGFRALKVWLALRQVGRTGYIKMIRDDIALTSLLFEELKKQPELETFTCELSITTFRFVPADLPERITNVKDFLDELNRELLERLQTEGEVFISNAILKRQFVLRACIVNFRTTVSDILAIPDIIVRTGRKIYNEKLSSESSHK